MVNEMYVEKLISLIKQGLLTVDDIKNAEYKTAVQAKLTTV